MNYSFFHPGNILALMRAIVIILFLILIITIGILIQYTGSFSGQLRYKLRTFASKFILLILNAKINVTGVPEKEEGTLYVINHRTLIDPLIAFSLIPQGNIMSKAEVKNYPVIGTGADLAGVVYIERSNKDSRSAAKLAMTKALKNKTSIIIFPEGTISISKSILRYRKGAFESAIEDGVKIQAVAMEYMNPKRDFWIENNLISQFFKTFSQWRIKVYVHFFNSEKSTDAIELCHKVESMTQEKLNEFQQKWKNQDDFFSS